MAAQRASNVTPLKRPKVAPPQESVASIDWTPERIARLVANLIVLLPEGQGLTRAFWVAVCHCRDFAELRAKCEAMERIAMADTSEAMQMLWQRLIAHE